MSRNVNCRNNDEVIRSFVEELRRLHSRAGRPPFAAMEEISSAESGLELLCRSTVNDLLRGKRVHMPKWPLVRSIVVVCHIYAKRNRAELGPLDGEREWYARWHRADRSVIDTAPWPVAGADSAGDDPRSGSRSGHERGEAHAGATPDPAAGPYRCDGDVLAAVRRKTMLTLTGHAEAMRWWHGHRDVVPERLAAYLSLEPLAELIRTYEYDLIPELLQTEEYARVVIGRGIGDAGATDVDRRVELRMRRQRILDGSGAVTLWAIIDEDALSAPHIPAAVMRAQVERLIRDGRRANVALQLMPSGHATAGGPVTMLRFPDRELPDLVYLGPLARGVYPDRPDDIHHYTQVLDRLGIEARKPAETVRFLNRFLADTSAVSG